ncbi:hypothetical protein [Solilutibacter silvestris]|uniref:hypothetical protein n=1 Tax=Solilutibacter silvestris TaxID=1645665 RepID=UPI003D337CA8
MLDHFQFSQDRLRRCRLLEQGHKPGAASLGVVDGFPQRRRVRGDRLLACGFGDGPDELRGLDVAQHMRRDGVVDGGREDLAPLDPVAAAVAPEGSPVGGDKQT